ncbi:MAG: BTAD domain-containing putative transcriptional regulator [Actinomycetota bacterium]|nr:BTAD domain-containing putative transcriptional regulator [Actinomycetota bacterium]
MNRAARRAGHAALSAVAGLTAAAVLAALIAGTPWLMWHVTGWPLPRHLPTLATLKAGIAGQESGRFILALVTCAGWVIWLVFVTEVILEAAWWARQLPGLARGPSGRPGAVRLRERAAAVSPPRAAATILVGGILLGLLAALRGTGAALTAPAAPRLAAITQQAAAAAPPYPGRHGDGGALKPCTAASGWTAVAPPEQAPAHAAGPAARAGGGVIRLDAALRPGQDQPGSPAYTLYTVQPGDNLWDIALTHLGDGEDWHQIYALNAGQLQPDGERLVLPSLIQPGWILRLPAPATAASSNGHVTSPPAPVTPVPGRAPPPGGEPSSSPRPSTHKNDSRAPARDHSHSGAGNAISIPWGGLVGAGLAGAVAGALAMAGVQRRRRYQPGRIISPSLEPGAPAPPLIGLLRRAARPADNGDRGENASVHAREPAQDAPPAVADTPAWLAAPAYSAPTQPPGLIGLGLRDGHEISADICALGGLGLTGPGAAAAARALLLTMLGQAQPGASALPAQVFVPAADAATLTPGVDPATQPGLTVTGTLTAALDHLEAAVLTRARITAIADDGSNPGTEQAALPPAGAAAVIATPDPACSPRLTSILRMGRAAGVAAILLGNWPDGVTCRAEADGTVTAAVPPHPDFSGLRLFHLTAPDAAAILSAFREAHGGTELQPQEEPAAGADGQPASGAAEPRAVADEGDPATTMPNGGAASAPEPVGAQDGPGARPAGNGVGVRVTLLGPPQITVAGREITGGLRKARELLALLAVHPDGATGDQVSEALWPGAPPGHGTAQRNIAVRKLREMLRTATGLHEAMFVTLAADRYRLEPALFDIDIWRFQRALLTARNARGEDAQLAAFRDAVAAYCGPLADGTGYDWAEPYAEHARRRALDAWTRIAEITAPRDPEQALAALETALGHDPYNEFIYEKIMRLQAAAGRPDAVRRTLGLLETRLTELGVTPGPQTRSLAASLLGSTTTVEPLRRSEAPLRYP